MEVESYRYPAGANPNFRSTYLPGSIRLKPQNLYKAKIYQNSGTHGILKTEYKRHIKERNINGYVMERGVPTYKFKYPKMYTESQLKEIKKTPLGGSIMRVVQNVNTEAYLNYNDLFQDTTGRLFRREILNGQERKVPAQDLADRRANFQALEAAREEQDQIKQQEVLAKTQQDINDAVQAIDLSIAPPQGQEFTAAEGTGVATGGANDMMMDFDEYSTAPSSPMSLTDEGTNLQQKLSSNESFYQQHKETVRAAKKIYENVKKLVDAGRAPNASLETAANDYVQKRALLQAVKDEIDRLKTLQLENMGKRIERVK